MGSLLKTRDAAFLFGTGMVLGTLGDSTHVATGMLGYPDSGWPAFPNGQPIWVLPEFAFATLLLAWIHAIGDRWFPSSRPRPGARNVKWAAFSGALILVTWALSGWLPGPSGGSKDWIMAAIAVGAWALLERTPQGLLLAALTALGGTLAETLLSSTGAFSYFPQVANLGRVPSWLPWLYVVVSVGIGNMVRYLNNRAVSPGTAS